MDQESCFDSEPGAGAKYMGNLERYPPPVRQRLRDSPFNLCLACLNHELAAGRYGVIEAMEESIRIGSQEPYRRFRMQAEEADYTIAMGSYASSQAAARRNTLLPQYFIDPPPYDPTRY